jgi:cytochrome c553
VFCDLIGASIADRLSMMNAEERQLWYGRALGRVVAHEMYHILTGEKQHASHGVAQAHFSPSELLSDDFRYDARQVRSLRSKLAPVVLSAFEWSGARDRKCIAGASLFIASGCSGCHGALAEGTAWGPSLRAGVDSPALARRLKNTHHEMYRRAKSMGVLWPPLTSTDVNEIATYLNAFRNSGASQARLDMIPEWRHLPQY